MMNRLTIVFLLSVLLYALAPTRAEYIAFSINGPGDPTEHGYDFDGPGGPFGGVWVAEEDSTNGHAVILEPDAAHSGWTLSPSIAVPWRSTRPAIDSAGYDWTYYEWVTNFTGSVTGLTSGDVVTVFFLYDPWCDEVSVTVEGHYVATLNASNEAALPPRLQRYGWVTEGVPAAARVFGCVSHLQDTELNFTLEPITASTSAAPVHVYGIVVDTANESRIDNDGDGSSDWDERVAGTDPFDAQSCFRITSIASQSNGCAVCWTSESNRVYRIVERTNLLQGDGTPLLTNITATPALNCVTVSTSEADGIFLSVEASEE